MACGPERPPGAGLARLARPWWPIVVILAWATVLFWPVLFGDRALFWHDASIQNIPLRLSLRQAVSQGSLPVWSWTFGGGYPVGCDVQSGLFYPLQAFDLTGLVTPERSFAVSAWLHFLLAGVGMWVFLGGCGIGIAGRLAAALGYMGSGFLAGHVMHVHLVWQAAWLPWLLVALGWLWRKPSLARAAVAGVPLGMMLLAGQPQIAFYGACAWGAWTLLAPLPDGVGRGRAVAWSAAAAAFGLLLGAGPYLPALDLYAASSRAELGAGHGGVFEMALDPPYWLLVLHPFIYGSYADNDYFGGAHHYEVCGYLAAPVLVLGLVGLISARAENRRLAAALAVLAVVALFMAAARQNPLYYLFGRWPPLGSFRAHARWVLLWCMSWSALAGIGADSLCSAPRRKIIALGTLVLAVWVGVPIFARAARPLAVGILAARKASEESAERKAAQKYEAMLKCLSWRDPYWAGLGLTGAALLAAGTAGLSGVAVGLCLATAAVEGAIYAHSYLPAVPVAYYREPPQTARVIMSDPGLLYVDPACREHQRPPPTYRGWSRDGTAYYVAEREAMRPNRSALWGVAGARCEMPLAPASQVRTMSELVPALLADPRTRPAGYRLLASLGVKWVIVPPDRAPAGSSPVATTMYSALYRVPDAQPPIRVCTGPIVSVGSEALGPAEVESLPSAKSALVTGRVKLPPGDGQIKQAVAGADGSLSLVADISRPSVVLLGVPLFPAHKATIDGRPATLVRVNGYCAGLILPAGRHRVMLTYDTTRFRQGALLYVSAWAILFVALARLVCRRRA